MEPQIYVEYNHHNQLPEITINPKGLPYLKIFKLRVFSKCLIEVYAEKGKIKGRLIPTLMEGTRFKFKNKGSRRDEAGDRKLKRREKRDVIVDNLDDDED